MRHPVCGADRRIVHGALPSRTIVAARTPSSQWYLWMPLQATQLADLKRFFFHHAEHATLRYSTHCATTPATALGSKPPSCVVENGTSQFLWCLNASDGLQPCARMNLRLRQHRRLRAEALDDRAHERTDCGRGNEHRRLALTRGVFEALAHQGDEFGEARRLHRQLTLVALADDRFGKRLFPL